MQLTYLLTLLGDSSRGASELRAGDTPKNGRIPGNLGGGIGASETGDGPAAGTALTGTSPKLSSQSSPTQAPCSSPWIVLAVGAVEESAGISETAKTGALDDVHGNSPEFVRSSHHP